MPRGFDLKTASLEIRKCASRSGIKSGRWEPRSAGRPVEALEDDEVVAVVWNSHTDPVEIHAWEVRYAQQYL